MILVFIVLAVCGAWIIANAIIGIARGLYLGIRDVRRERRARR
jgi:hypothetical protein